MWPSFSLCACRILKMRSCLRSPLAPGSSKVLAILVSSVMFFSFNSAMVMIHLNPFTETLVVSALSGDFQRRVFRERQKLHQAGGQGCFRQPVVVPQQNSPAPTELPVAPCLRFGPKHRSWFPGFWCWADGTSAWPWRRAGKAYNGSAMFVKRQTHDQSAYVNYSFLIYVRASRFRPCPGKSGRTLRSF